MGVVAGEWMLGGGGDGRGGVHLLGGSWRGGRSPTLGVVLPKEDEAGMEAGALQSPGTRQVEPISGLG